MSQEFTTPEVTSDDKLWAALSYVFSPLVPIILLLMEDKKNRAFIRYHSVQALVAGLVFWLISVPTCGFGFILWLIMFYWAYKSYQGEMVEIPVITNFIKNQGWV